MLLTLMSWYANGSSSKQGPKVSLFFYLWFFSFTLEQNSTTLRLRRKNGCVTIFYFLTIFYIYGIGRLGFHSWLTEHSPIVQVLYGAGKAAIKKIGFHFLKQWEASSLLVVWQ